MNTSVIHPKRALISVSDKTDIIEFAKALSQTGVEIISTGGTFKALTEANIPATEISNFTGFPEMMDGRVKTLHPLVHGGILGLRDKHAQTANEHNIRWIDLVVCNLYPFSATIQKPNVTEEEAIENIDIGGPSMIRSAAKNIGWVSVVVDPNDYSEILSELKAQGGITHGTRRKLSAKAYSHTAQYDSIIANYFKTEQFPEHLTLSFDKLFDVRYGENPHQKAAIYKEPNNRGINILNAKILQGKQLSYNNINDADGALALTKEFTEPACVVVKHANPCGVATGSDITEVFKRAYNADPLSAFGGIISLNRRCTKAIAEEIAKVFAEIVLAPSFEPEALQILAAKKNLRLLELGELTPPTVKQEFRYVDGGMLVQDRDVNIVTREQLKIVTKKQPTIDEINTMLFAWKVLKYMKSNAILLAKDNTTVGVGVGQVSRVDAVELAIKKAGSNVSGSILASDAFFPFRDSIDKIAQSGGISAIIQPGGSIKDEEVIAACDEHGISMAFTGVRCFKH
jgi:phosphoribosylaminoimidazolecarboxamide formyltransferase/IMP cyclohydrolase